MTQLHRVTPAGASNIQADVVFVHGLDGDKLATWTNGDDPQSFWPQWLSHDLPSVAVHCLGYDASSSAWFGHAMPLFDRATNVLARLQADELGKRPLIFICHSLGGLVVKQLIHTAATNLNPRWKKIVASIKGVVFLATPHAGAPMANYLSLLGKVLRVTAAIKDLQAHDDHLRELSLWYSHSCQQLGVENQVFYEMRNTYGVRVVNETSATIGVGNVYPVGIDADHISICKPANREALVYKLTLQFIRERANVQEITGPLPPPPGPALDPGDPFYVERDADARAREAASAIRSVVVHGPGQTGKSSLLLRYLSHCEQAGKRVALVDLNGFGTIKEREFPDFAEQFARALVDEFQLKSTPIPTLPDVFELTHFLQTSILPQIDAPAVIAIDEADRVIGSKWQEEFYCALRGWDTARRQPHKKKIWGRLSLAFAISTDPKMLIESGYTSPFNISPPIVLGNFQREALDRLNGHYGHALSPAQLSELYRLLKGHPYLTHLALHRIVCGEYNIDSICSNAADDFGPFGEHLQSRWQMLHKGNLLDAMRCVIRNGKVPDRRLFYRLEAAGIVCGEGESLVPTNDLYRRYFEAVL